MKVKRDRRRWVTTLAADVPPGPAGQPAHAAGAEVAVIMPVVLTEVGVVSLTVPRPSALLLASAHHHINRALRLRGQLAKQVKRGKWVQPGLELGFSNDELVFDFFEEAMAGVVLAHTALDNFTIECLPEDARWHHPEQNRDLNRLEIESLGVENRLSRVLAEVLDRPNLRTQRPDTWERVMELKALRDDVGHARRRTGYTQVGEDPLAGLFSRILAADLRAITDAVDVALTHYE